MNVNLKVTKKEGANMSNIITQMCRYKCSVNMDLANNAISIVGIDDDNIENLLDSIGENFEFSEVEIIPAEETEQPKQTEIVSETEESKEPEIWFEDEKVQKQAEELLNVASWTLKNTTAVPIDISQAFKETKNGIGMKYGLKLPPTDIKVGDIVEVDFGWNLKGETSGERIHAIVCNIAEDLVYVVPVTKVIHSKCKTGVIPFYANRDAIYTDSRYLGGTAIVKKGRYVNKMRLGNVCGIVLPELFNKVLLAISSEFNFTGNIAEYTGRPERTESDDCMLEFESSNEKAENQTDELSSTEKLSAEDYISCIVLDELNSLDTSQKLEECAKDFLDAIDLPVIEEDKKIIEVAFTAGCNVSKVNYENILLEISKAFPDKTEDKVKKILRVAFKDWLDMHPDVRERYPKVSIMALIKIFVKKIK